MTTPPGNSLSRMQGERVADPGEDVVAGLYALLARVRDEIDFNEAKGSGPYRLGAHDALRFAEDAITDLLRQHGLAVETRTRSRDA